MRYQTLRFVFLGVFLLASVSGTASGLNQATTQEKSMQAKQPSGTLADLDPAKATAQAPETFRVNLDTTKGPVVIEVVRAWAPRGADRFYNLVKAGYFKDIAFFRVISGFMAQFGIHGNPSVSAVWRTAQIKDDPVKQSNLRGFVTFAMSSAPNSRTTQFFINYGNNARLDSSGFSPFGRVIQGMENIDLLYSDYGEGAPRGRGPDQSRVQTEGNAYLKKEFPKLDYIKSATIVE